jgi:hypothetical protein
MTRAAGPGGRVPPPPPTGPDGHLAGTLSTGDPTTRRTEAAPMTGIEARPGAEARTGVETKPSFKTTEFFVFLAAVVAVVVTAVTVNGDATTADPFGAEQALRYITFLAIGYMVSRGLAKVGSRHPDTDRR